MSDDVYLRGAEDVARAGHEMSSAAERMVQAANQIDESLHRQRVFLDEWLDRFDAAVAKAAGGGK